LSTIIASGANTSAEFCGPSHDGHLVRSDTVGLVIERTVWRRTMALTIFLSYASEDQKFADAIAERLGSTFKYSVDLKYMAQFQLGVNFRTLIDKALDNTHILLVIATGREKLSHSFTGYEVGFFRRSQQEKKYIDEGLKIERLVIPIALFADIPATLSDIEGIGIAEPDRFLFDEDTATKAKMHGEDPFFNLLVRIDGILAKLEPVDRSPDQQMDIYTDYRRVSETFYQALQNVMSSLPLRKEIPKTRLLLKLPGGLSSKDIELESHVTLACFGPTSGIFERDQSDQWVSWPEFSERIGGDDIALTWNDALTSLLASTVAGNFANSDQLVFSFDEKKLFRLFISSVTTFFDRHREIDVYVVEVYRCKDVGNPFTTFLAKAIAIALRYRSLFLEDGSPYGPIAVRLAASDTRKATIKELIQELRLLLLEGREAGLDEKPKIIELYGSDQKSVEKILATIKVWLDQKTKLYKSAEAVLTEANPSDSTFDMFWNTLTEFCAQTKSMNAEFTTTVLRRLGDELKAE
jgi:hypothetical protein